VLAVPETPSVVDEKTIAATPSPVAPLASRESVVWLEFLTMVLEWY
jgi:hypothetical protein